MERFCRHYATYRAVGPHGRKNIRIQRVFIQYKRRCFGAHSALTAGGWETVSVMYEPPKGSIKNQFTERYLWGWGVGIWTGLTPSWWPGDCRVKRKVKCPEVRQGNVFIIYLFYLQHHQIKKNHILAGVPAPVEKLPLRWGMLTDSFLLLLWVTFLGNI